jgi:hypothetical protein
MRVRKLISAILLMVLVGGLAVILLRSGAFAPRRPAEPSEEPSSRPDDRSPALGSLPPRSIADSAPAAPSFARRVAVRVRDAEGRPLVNAALRLEYRTGQFVHRADVRVPAAARDGEIATGADGTVVLADFPGQRFWLVGSAGDRTGFLDLDPAYFGRTEDPVLVMLPPKRVEVSVRDKQGAPVPGVEVEATEGAPVSPARGWTDETGVARFDVTPIDAVQYALPQVKVMVKAGLIGTVWSEQVPWAPQGTTRIATEIAGAHVTRIVVIDDGKGPPTVSRRITVTPTTSNGFSFARGREFAGSTTYLGIFDLGSEVTFKLEEPGRRPFSKRVTLAGTGITHVLFDRGQGAARLRLHVVEASGADLARAVVMVSPDLPPKPAPEPAPDPAPSNFSRLQLSYDRGPEPIVWAPTDARGRIELDVDPDRPGSLVFRRCDLGQTWHPESQVTITHPAIRPGEIAEVTVRLPEIPTIVQGLVLDPDGDPVSGATVTLEPRPVGAEPQNLGGVTHTSGDDGTFSFRGNPPAAPQILRAIHPDLGRSQLVDLDARSDAPVVLQLVAFGTLTGRVLVAGIEDPPQVRLTLEPSSKLEPRFPAWRPVPDRRSVDVPPDGRFAVGGLPAGSYDVAILLDDVLVLTVPGVTIEPGRDCVDPRLHVTVGANVRVETVSVRDLSGKPIASARVTLHEGGSADDAPAWQTRSTGPDGKARVLLADDRPVLVRVLRGEYVRWRRDGASFPLEVLLSPLIDVPVVLDADGPIPTGGGYERYCVLLSGTNAGVHDSARQYRGYVRPPDAAVTVRHVSPGDYRVFLAPSATHIGPFGGNETNPGWIDLGTVTVLEGQVPPPLKLRVPLEDCRHLIGEVR